MSEEYACFGCKHFRKKTIQLGFTSVCEAGQGHLQDGTLPKKKCAKLEKIGQQVLKV